MEIVEAKKFEFWSESYIFDLVSTTSIFLNMMLTERSDEDVERLVLSCDPVC